MQRHGIAIFADDRVDDVTDPRPSWIIRGGSGAQTNPVHVAVQVVRSKGLNIGAEKFDSR
jgi:hypothetical protein